MINGNIFDIVRGSTVDGPGIRTTVFFKGCNLRCKWCHNPESQNPYPEIMYYANRCIHCGACLKACPNHLNGSCSRCGKCVEFCPNEARKLCGKTMNVDDVFNVIKKDVPFYEASNGGVTFSGGECMLQIDFLLPLLKRCKEEGINTAIDTAGYVDYTSFEKVLPYTDVFLYDIKAFTPKLHKELTGVDNSIILDNLKKLIKTNKKIIIRIPVIKDINDDYNELTKIRDFLKPYAPIDVELLPYHRLGENKYLALGRPLEKFIAPEKEEMESLNKLFFSINKVLL